MRSSTSLTVAASLLVCQGSGQTTVDDHIKVARSALKADRKATVAETTQM